MLAQRSRVRHALGESAAADMFLDFTSRDDNSLALGARTQRKLLNICAR